MTSTAAAARPQNPQQNSPESRLRAFALLLKFGHDLFDAKNFDEAVANAVNNAVSLLQFRTASLLELNAGKSVVLAQFGHPEPNRHSRLAVLHNKLTESLRFDREPITMTKENGLYEELAENNGVYYCIRLSPPANTPECAFSFVWLLEFEKEVPAYVPNTAKLLATSISEALYYQKLCKSNLWNVGRHAKKRWAWGLLLCLVAAAMFFRVPESATAEFTLKPPEITATYAWFDGPVAKCLRQDGDAVRKGDDIAEYDTSQLRYRIGVAEAALREIEAELALERQNSFTDQEKLGKVKLLEARRDTAKVAVDEAKWYLDHSKLQAPADGILSLADGRAELLTGKAVRTGDKIFEIFGGAGMIAEIPINERDASILQETLSATLFLHTAPETAIPVEILDISHYPELTDQRTYCYKVRVRMPDDLPALRYGMRGIAKISAGDVPLWYALFKSAVLYFRGL